MLETFIRSIVRTFFREIVIDGEDRLPESGPVIFTPNHPNDLLDPLLLYHFSPRFRIRFVAKSTLFSIPVFGFILRRIGSIPVTRRLDTQGVVDYTAFFGACVEALNKGDSIVIFPEGRSLPQPYLAPLKTGPARLFFMAKEKGINAQIVPVGLNYESGAIFRSSVLISVAPPLNTTPCEEEAKIDSREGIHCLTAEIGRMLDQHVFQAETFRDRELILLLERLYSENNISELWPERLSRLKEFENGFEELRTSHANEIQRLRHLLSRYQKLSSLSGIDVASQSNPKNRSLISILAGFAGMLVATLGVVLNWLPYHLVDFLVKSGKKDESDAATYKIVYSIFLFPITYFFEGWLLERWFGWSAAILFSILIIPLTYFTLLFWEWRGEAGGISTRSNFWLGGSSHRITEQLTRIRTQIVEQVNQLASLRKIPSSSS